MRRKSILLSLLACFALAVSSQPTQQAQEWEWYLDDVVSETFVGRNYFEYYYTPSASDMEQQRSNGEVSYFLNTPAGLNSKKVRDMIDRLMASYDDITPVCDWQMTATTYWKEFRFEKNKFRFSVKRKELDDGTYYVSVTETAGYYKSLGKAKKESTKASPEQTSKASAEPTADKPVKRKGRGRRAITQDDVEAADGGTPVADDSVGAGDDEVAEPVMTEQQRRRAAREREQALKDEERLAKRREQEQRREEIKAQKEAEKLKKAEEKKKSEEERRLKKEEEQRQREQARLEREQARKQAAAPKPVESRYHCSDVSLWLSEKYDFTQTDGDGASTCSMFSTAVKDVEMAKLAIKNALKGSNARMAVPWRVNSNNGKVETGYSVDGHVLVFAVGKNDEGNVTLDIIEVSGEQFEEFKQGLDASQ